MDEQKPVPLTCILGYLGENEPRFLNKLIGRWQTQVQALAKDIVLCPWTRHFILTTVPLSSKVYKCLWHPTQGEEGAEILLVTSCYRNRDKPQPAGPLGSFADLYEITLARTPLTPRPTVSPSSGKPCLHQARRLLANSSSSTTPAQ